MATKAIKGKATPREVVHQQQVDDRVRRAMPPPSDPGGRHHASLRDLADQHGVPVAELVESWSERAACRTYLGGVSVQEAEALAVADVREWLERRAA